MLGLGYANLQRTDKARRHLRRAMELGVRDADTVLGLAGVLRELGDLKGAVRVVDDVLALDPKQPKALRFKAWALRSLDKSDAALALLDGAIADGVWSPEISVMRSELLRQFRRFAESVEESNRLLDQPGLPSEMRRDGLHTLGLTYDAMGEYDLAFDAIARANAMLDDKEVLPIESFRKAWPKEVIDEIPESGETSRKPVFVIGMPRSGTTLTERILAAHPRVASVGESNAMTTLMRDRVAVDMTADAVRRVAEGYLDRMGMAKFDKVSRVVDKMPENYFFVPAILKALPGASIIHCTRDARDTCLSYFFQNFGGLQPWSRRITTAAKRYVQYRQLMEYWDEVLGPDILEDNYE
ncbi:MAG: sulfotransferase, partial [Phycisphaerales bacterium]|nr:sulfotransferase [Phycisphaerales bacterium]